MSWQDRHWPHTPPAGGWPERHSIVHWYLHTGIPYLELDHTAALTDEHIFGCKHP